MHSTAATSFDVDEVDLNDPIQELLRERSLATQAVRA